jgi:NAD(P)H-hydrate epimerase
VLRRFPGARSFAAVCGGGANGGDGQIAAELLRAAGWEERALGEADVVIDALFGTGFRPPPRDEAAEQIRAMNASGSPVVAVDIPSGVDASTGEVPGEAVDAAVTVTFHGRKGGARWLRAVQDRRVVVADIGLEHGRPGARASSQRSLGWFRSDRVTTKYTAGSVLVVGGSPGMTGASR